MTTAARLVPIGKEHFAEAITRIVIGAQMLEDARFDAEKLGQLRNSMTKGEGNIYGKLGERISHDVLGGSLDDTYDYDILLPSGVRLDVKSKRLKGRPFPDLSCNVSHYNTRQDCHAYLFVRVSDKLECGWVLGWYPKKQFYLDGEQRFTGQCDTSNGHVEHCDSTRLFAHQLYHLNDLPSWRP